MSLGRWRQDVPGIRWGFRGWVCSREALPSYYLGERCANSTHLVLLVYLLCVSCQQTDQLSWRADSPAWPESVLKPLVV